MLRSPTELLPAPVRLPVWCATGLPTNQPCGLPCTEERFVVGQRLFHECVENAQDCSSFLLLNVEPLCRGDALVAIHLAILQRAVELRDGCFEVVEERRWKPVRDECVLMNRRRFRHAARASEKGLADHRRLRHLERGELRSRAQIPSRNDGDRLHLLLAQRDAKLVLFRGFSFRAADARVLVHRVRGITRRDVVESLPGRGEIDASGEKRRVIVEKPLRSQERIECGVLSIFHNVLKFG